MHIGMLVSRCEIFSHLPTALLKLAKFSVTERTAGFEVLHCICFEFSDCLSSLGMGHMNIRGPQLFYSFFHKIFLVIL